MKLQKLILLAPAAALTLTSCKSAHVVLDSNIDKLFRYASFDMKTQFGGASLVDAQKYNALFSDGWYNTGPSLQAVKDTDQNVTAHSPHGDTGVPDVFLPLELFQKATALNAAGVPGENFTSVHFAQLMGIGPTGQTLPPKLTGVWDYANTNPDYPAGPFDSYPSGADQKALNWGTSKTISDYKLKFFNKRNYQSASFANHLGADPLGMDKFKFLGDPKIKQARRNFGKKNNPSNSTTPANKYSCVGDTAYLASPQSEVFHYLADADLTLDIQSLYSGLWAPNVPGKEGLVGTEHIDGGEFGNTDRIQTAFPMSDTAVYDMKRMKEYNENTGMNFARVDFSKPFGRGAAAYKEQMTDAEITAYVAGAGSFESDEENDTMHEFAFMFKLMFETGVHGSKVNYDISLNKKRARFYVKLHQDTIVGEEIVGIPDKFAHVDEDDFKKEYGMSFYSFDRISGQIRTICKRSQW